MLEYPEENWYHAVRMNSSISFLLDGKTVTIDFQDPSGPTPTTTLLNYLRSLPEHKGVKEGCAEGDCGACTVVLGERQTDGSIRYKSIDSCLVFLPMLHGKQLITVENLKDQNGELHPVQHEMVETSGSQCGYCTPGIVMSLFSLYKNHDHPSRLEIDDALTGNLCRCTGYKPIVEAAAKSCVHQGKDHLTKLEPQTANLLRSIPNDSLQLKSPQQRYHQPATLQEALELKRQYPDANVINGATDIALRVTKRHELLKYIIDLSAVSELKEILESGPAISIGAGVSLNEAMPISKTNFPALYDMLAVFGSQQIRNLATFGGNLGTASPIGDTLPVLMAYNGSIVLQNPDGRREVPLDEYVTGYRTTVRKLDELIAAIVIPKVADGAIVKSYKVSKRKDLDISTVSSGFRLELNGGTTVKKIKLVYGGMAERTKRASAAEQFLTNRKWERKVVEVAMGLIDKEFNPISDARSGAEFRKIAARNLLLKFWSEVK
jgi:xanthine dehydrogenase small subunit